MQTIRLALVRLSLAVDQLAMLNKRDFYFCALKYIPIYKPSIDPSEHKGILVFADLKYY